MKITEGIERVDGVRGSAVYLVEDGDGLTVIDTGLSGATEKVLQAVAGLGRKPADVRQIVVTHCHGDHTGSLAELAERSGAQVCVHAADAPMVRGEQRMPPMKAPGVVAIVLRPLLERMTPAPRPWRVDRELQDGDEVGGLGVVHTPGHTPGHIALHMSSKRVLFAGDALFNVLGLRPPPGIFTADAIRARESIRKLAGLEFDIVCFGHGRALTREAAARLRRFAEGLH